MQAQGSRPALFLSEFRLWTCYICGAHTYAEVGTGRSLTYAAEHHKQLEYMFASDTDETWLMGVKRHTHVAQKVLEQRAFLYHLDIGPMDIYGYPEGVNKFRMDGAANGQWFVYNTDFTGATKEVLANASANLQRYLEPPLGVQWWDVIFGDGPFRLQTAIYSLSRIAPGQEGQFVILVHDLLDHTELWKQEWEVLARFVDVEACAGRLVSFRKKLNVDGSDLQQQLKQLIDSARIG
eukprot:gnl/TRDRNA2_/TRDRNA2_166004_c0_seq1.p1 gnl/TRDRNA2_/TRDRNA2_166004_c0~~gnl/TRDRNA2_/TRDRNA2_166004_c0_seq1.p1  ORF type:complete len:237 (+),score=21.75 gnl/TRDRNA2_/TRDRNA2_166004_c0_seq1:21-731(+)